MALPATPRFDANSSSARPELPINGEPPGAVYLDPAFARAAFELGRVHASLGDSQAARRAFRQALKTLEDAEVDDHVLLGELDATGMASACRTNLSGSSEAGG
jgi:hypothetical protein